MAAQKGREVLLKIGDTESPTNFTTIGGGETHEISLNDEPVDVTDKSSTERWAERIRGGIRSAEITMSGIFKDSAAETSLLSNFMDANDALLECQIIIPSFYTFTGFWIVSNLRYGGEKNGAATFSATFTSANQIIEASA